MEFNKEFRPKVGFGVYIINDKNQILLMHRIGSHSSNTWCPPGGHLEFKESFLDGAKRETKEESGLDIEDIELVGVTNDIYETENKHYVTLALKAKAYKGEPKIIEPDKCDEVAWFDLDKMPSNLMLTNKNFFNSNPECLCGSGKKYFDCHKKLGS